MAELVNAEKARDSIRGQLKAFDSYTGRIESAAASIEGKLAQAWDNADARLGEGAGTLADVDTRMKELRPKFEAALESGRASILETRDGLAKSVDSAREKVRSARKDATDKLADWRTQAAEYKNSFPPKLQTAREWSERFIPTADKIDHFLARAEDQLDKGIASTRATLAGYVEAASEIEEQTFDFSRRPDILFNKPAPQGELAKEQQQVWGHELARRQYAELRAELGRLRQGLTATEASDKERLARIDRVIHELDAQLSSGLEEREGKRRKGSK
jgi:vacuolar-type H+-ATPase subunit I/STV1